MYVKIGISEPLQVAETFTFGLLANEEDKEEEEEDKKISSNEAIQTLSDIARVDTMVTVVDAKNFESYLGCTQRLLEKWGDDETQKAMIPEEDDRHVSHLLIDQVEFANVIMINKIDLVDKNFKGKMDDKYVPNKKIKHIAQLCNKLNPNARIMYSVYSEVDLKSILNSKSFSFNEAALNSGWLKEIKGDMKPESEEYGITSFVYRARKPFHPERLQLIMVAKMMKGVYRAKGFFWMCTQHDTCFDWNQAGDVVNLGLSGTWLATIPDEQWKEQYGEEMITDEVIQEIKKDFEGEYGDRRQEIVFIGDKTEMSIEEITEQLDFCLLTEKEMKLGVEGWKQKIKDPICQMLSEKAEQQHVH